MRNQQAERGQVYGRPDYEMNRAQRAAFVDSALESTPPFDVPTKQKRDRFHHVPKRVVEKRPKKAEIQSGRDMAGARPKSQAVAIERRDMPSLVML